MNQPPSFVAREQAPLTALQEKKRNAAQEVSDFVESYLLAHQEASHLEAANIFLKQHEGKNFFFEQTIKRLIGFYKLEKEAEALDDELARRKEELKDIAPGILGRIEDLVPRTAGKLAANDTRFDAADQDAKFKAN